MAEGALVVGSQITLSLGADSSDGVYDKFGIPHVIPLSATRVVVAVPWRDASSALNLRLILLDQNGAQVASTDLPWIQYWGETEAPLARVSDTQLLEATYVYGAGITGITARRIAVTDAGFSVDYVTTSAAALQVKGLALAPGLDMAVASGLIGGTVEGFMALDVATGSVLWSATETVTGFNRPEYLAGPDGALTFFYFAASNQPSSHSWTLTRTGATSVSGASPGPFPTIDPAFAGGNTNPAYASGSTSLTVYDSTSISCYVSGSTTPSTPVSVVAKVVPNSKPYRRSTIEEGSSPLEVAVGLAYDPSGSATLVSHTPTGVVTQVAIPDLLLVFGRVRFGCGISGLGAIADAGAIPIVGSYFSAWVVHIWMFTVELVLAAKPSPLRQVQRDDGLGRSVMRARGTHSVQRSIRQRGYR